MSAYRCGNGHDITAPAHLSIGRCPVYVLGHACPAPIRHVGAGSRAKNRQLGDYEYRALAEGMTQT